MFGKTFFDWFGDVFCFSTETEGEGEDSRFFFATSVLAQQEGLFDWIDGGMPPMHAMGATIGDDSRMALAAGGLESMPLGENADRVAEKSVSTKKVVSKVSGTYGRTKGEKGNKRVHTHKKRG